jgi:hypothetical protein
VRVGQAVGVDDVPAVVAGLVGAVEEVNLVAASADSELRSRDSPCGREIALDLNRQCLRDRVELPRPFGCRGTRRCVAALVNNAAEASDGRGWPG